MKQRSNLLNHQQVTFYLGLMLLFIGSLSFSIQAQPVISAHGFKCGKEKGVVTCKGPLPNGKDSITGSGKDFVYLTVNTDVGGIPSRYSYFSDTGCMVGYTFDAAGKPAIAIAAHRNGEKKKIKLKTEGFQTLSQFCASKSSGSLE